MVPFSQGEGTAFHQTSIENLDPDTNVVNIVNVRCASHPDFLLQLNYRSLPEVNPSYPRTGNLWGWGNFIHKPIDEIAKIDLWVGVPNIEPATIQAMRKRNPNILILSAVNAINGSDLPDDYFLKDVNGRRQETWTGSYRLNITKPYVAEYQAKLAYNKILENNLMIDGLLFDNIETTISSDNYDMYGRLFQFDADENGIADDPTVLDAAWKEGLLHELNTFKALMPNAIMMGHSLDIHEPGIADIFNGKSIGFRTADVLEGEKGFWVLWDEYNDLEKLSRKPQVTMIESSPPDQISYGYDYSPWEKIPASTLKFAQSYYPYVRFGLAVTLMNDGYFTHEFGDTWHGNDWWYDELNFNLGYPLGPAERVDLGIPASKNLLANAGFEDPIVEPWRLDVSEKANNNATLTQDFSEKVSGSASARVDITAASGTDWHIELAQYSRSIVQGESYELSFWAKSDRQRTIALDASKGVPDWRDYGLTKQVTIETSWKKYVISFNARETASDARIQFLLGGTTGTVWMDDASLIRRPPDVYRRKFTNGMVLLNGSGGVVTVPVGPGYYRLFGLQAPRYETILDDRAGGFSTTGAWTEVKYDSGLWQVTGPFFHCWKEICHQRSGSTGEASWTLPISQADTYTISAWWPAAPQAGTFNANVTYEVVAGGKVVASQILDQRSGGDQWHAIATVPLSPGSSPTVRVRCQGSAPCLADALHLTSSARYNDGSAAPDVTLQPLDGIILSRSPVASFLHLPVVRTR